MPMFLERCVREALNQLLLIMSQTERDQHKSDCLREALIEGAKASAWALATSGLLVGLANQFLPAFRSSLGVSGKTALIVRLFMSNVQNE